MLIEDLPINPEHGAVAGAEFEIIEISKQQHQCMKYWFIGATGHRCAAFGRECVVELKGGADETRD